MSSREVRLFISAMFLTLSVVCFGVVLMKACGGDWLPGYLVMTKTAYLQWTGLSVVSLVGFGWVLPKEDPTAIQL